MSDRPQYALRFISGKYQGGEFPLRIAGVQVNDGRPGLGTGNHVPGNGIRRNGVVVPMAPAAGRCNGNNYFAVHDICLFCSNHGTSGQGRGWRRQFAPLQCLPGGFDRYAGLAGHADLAQATPVALELVGFLDVFIDV